LLKLAGDPVADVRVASLDTLRRLGERRALPAAVQALANRETALAGLEYLASHGGPEQAEVVAELARREPSAEVLAAVGKSMTTWLRRNDLKPAERSQLQLALAKLQGASGMLLVWRTNGPLDPDSAGKLVQELAAAPTSGSTSTWPMVLASGLEARVPFGPVRRATDTWLAFTEIEMPESVRVELFTASTGLETIWLNEKVVFQRQKPGVAGANPDRREADLAKGTNRVLVRLSESQRPAEFQLRFRRKGANPVQERFAAAALSRTGNPARGRQVFLNAEKSLCVKCHRVGDTGEPHGPELTGLGSRFSKVYIIESILEPSRTVSPSFESLVIDLKNGRSLTGLKVEETDTSLVIVDREAKKHPLAKADIEAQRKSLQSAMPDGLEKTLSEEEFVDLVSYLVSLKSERDK